MRIVRPIVILDEAHNATTERWKITFPRFRPSCILEFTATPRPESHSSGVKHNVIFNASAEELEREEMIKLPVRLTEHPEGWRQAVAGAVAEQKRLEEIARQHDDTVRPNRPLQSRKSRGRSDGRGNQNLPARSRKRRRRRNRRRDRRDPRIGRSRFAGFELPHSACDYDASVARGLGLPFRLHSLLRRQYRRGDGGRADFGARFADAFRAKARAPRFELRLRACPRKQLFRGGATTARQNDFDGIRRYRQSLRHAAAAAAGDRRRACFRRKAESKSSRKQNPTSPNWTKKRESSRSTR